MSTSGQLFWLRVRLKAEEWVDRSWTGKRYGEVVVEYLKKGMDQPRGLITTEGLRSFDPPFCVVIQPGWAVVGYTYTEEDDPSLFQAGDYGQVFFE